VSGLHEIGLLFGRLHVLLVHLPIGLIVLLTLLEVLGRYPRFKHATANTGLILAFAVPMVVFTVICGLLLSQASGYDVHLLQLHKWTGIGTGAACVLAAVFYWLDVKKAYRFVLYCSFGVLVIASHFGGSLTHGSDYLARYAPGPLRSWLGGGQTKVTQVSAQPKDFKSQPVFATVVQPILEKNCVSCHGPEKSKGKLLLDSLAATLKGGENGPVIVAGKSGDSELIKRLKLDPSSDDHMPPDGKPQPSQDEIALLQWWIDAGAPGDKKIGELNPPPVIARVLQARLGPPPTAAREAQSVPPKPLEQLKPLVAQLSGDLGIVIGPVAQTNAWLQCNASVAGTNFGDPELSRLAPLAPNLRWLDLGGTRVTDAGLAAVASMPNLKRLHLERTPITDAGLKSLTRLPALEYLDLYGTAVTDAGLAELQSAPRLKQVYLWQTQVSSTGAQAFVEARTDKAQLERWQQEIEELKTKIRDGQIRVEMGTAVAAASSTNAAPINTVCPISGKPIDPSKTVLYQGKLLAFCCDDCKAKFQADPKPVLAKLGLSATNSASTPASGR
jgi:YHS domain-containing protein/uncharacterized membrane protein